MKRPSTSSKKIRVLLADRVAVFRLGLKKLFAIEDDLRVVAQAEIASQVPGLAKKFRPDLLLLQAEIAEEGGPQYLHQLRREAAGVRILVTLDSDGRGSWERFQKAGAAGVIEKTSEPDEFVRAARKIAGGGTWFPERAAEAASGAESIPDEPRPVETLTDREKSIISCLLQGWRNREIAQHLSITEQTVKNHLRAVYDKVGVSDRLELVLFAIHHRLSLPPVSPAAAP